MANTQTADPYASIAQPVAPPSSDPYSSIAQPAAQPTSEPSPQDLANIQLAQSGIKVGGSSAMPATPDGLKTTGLDRAATAIQKSPAFDVVNSIAKFYPDTAMGAAKSAGQTVVGADNLIRAGMRKVGIDPNKHPSVAAPIDETDFGLDKGSLELHGAGEHIGGFAETLAEFLYGEGEVKAAGKALGLADRYKGLAKLAETIESHPKIAMMVKGGIDAAKQATIAGTQTLLKTNGDESAATDAAIWTAGLSILTHGATNGVAAWLRKRAATSEVINGVETTVPADVRNAKPTPQQAEGQAVYRKTAQESARPALEDINAAREPKPVPIVDNPTDENALFQQAKKELGPDASISQIAMRAQELKLAAKAAPVADAEAVSQGVAQNNARAELGSTSSTVPERMMPKTQPASGAGSQTATVPSSVLGQKTVPEVRTIVGDARPTSPLPKININEQLNRVHDFTGAADLVEEHAKSIYQTADELSDGEFRKANDALRVAQKAAWNATGKETGSDAAGGVIEAKNAMEDVLKNLKGKMSPEEITAARSAFRQTYVLRDVANTLDSSWTGIPGASNRGNAYRGFDGQRLMSGLQKLVRNMGRAQVESAIGGQRLDALERIAELNRTNSQRARFGAAVHEVAKWIVPHVSTLTLGGLAGHQLGVGWEVGAAGGYAVGQASERVMKAVLGNPRIAQNLIYALESGARPENYGPMIGTMVGRLAQENSRDDAEKQAQNENGEDKQ